MTQKAVLFEKKKIGNQQYSYDFSNYLCFFNIVTNPSLILRRDQ